MHVNKVANIDCKIIIYDDDDDSCERQQHYYTHTSDLCRVVHAFCRPITIVG
jgi:hypothetical protein